MDKYLKQLTAFLKSLTVRQQILLGAAGVAIALTLWIFVRLFSAPEMKPLYTGLSSEDAQGIAQRLAADNVAYTISPDGGTISVPGDKLDQLRLELSTQGPPQTGRLGFELFDKPNWSGSDFSEHVNYQRALEGELERTIDTIDDVQASRVHIVMPHESLFTSDERKGKAAVVIRLREGARLPQTEVTGVARLVSSAVDNLPVENVTVIDADTGAPIQASAGEENSPFNPTLDSQLAQKIVNTLTPIVGDGRVKASVTLERDPTSGDSTQEIYDPNGSVVLTSQISQEGGSEATPSGVPGTASNVPRATGQNTAATVASSGANSQTLHTESKTFAVGKTVKRLVEPAGRIKRMTVAVLVDDPEQTQEVNGKKVEVPIKRTADEMKEIQNVAMAAVGFDASRGDQIAVQDFPFQTIPVEQPIPPTMVQRVEQFTQQWMMLFRYLGVLLVFVIVYLFLLRPIKRQLVASFHDTAAVQATRAPAIAIASGAAGGAGTTAAGKMADLDQEVIETNSDVKRVVMLKRDLVEKVKKEPDAAGRLIQNWIRQSDATR